MSRDRPGAYRLFLAAGPVARDAHGAYVITDATAAGHVLRHPELFSSARAFETLGSPFPIVPLASDPPEHTRYRKILAPFFGARGTARWLPEVRALAGQLIDRFIARGSCDVVAEFAEPLPAQVFLTLFGLPLQDRDRLIAWKEALLSAVGISGAEPPPDEVIVLAAELYEYLTGHIAGRRGQPGDDVLTSLLAGAGDPQMSDEEILGLSFVFVLAGLDTVTSALSTAFAALAADGELRRAITADPGVIPAAVEELLRSDGPVVTVPRVATRDVEVAGTLIPAGSYVAVAIGAANHDPAQFADPAAVNLGRGGRHLAFGGGPHLCLGAHLARLEMRVALEEWHARIPEYRLAPATDATAGWPAALVGYDHLWLEFGPLRHDPPSPAVRETETE
ncbi:MAG TPA: cytochrome P450 [Streptosporangiaceae bacterium]